MDYRITSLETKKLVGKRLVMTFSNNKTFALWQSFMPRRKEIQNNIGPELYSVQIYAPHFFEKFNPDTEFEKWAAIEVSGFDNIPDDLESLTIPDGLYAVFLYKGSSGEAASAFQYILGSWLPDSGYMLDNRPHFEVLGEKYKNNDPGSEEELWIPIKLKNGIHNAE